MGFGEWARSFFFNRNTGNLKDCISYELQAEVVYKQLAIETCVDLIAKALARCEFKTFEKGQTYRGNNYYLLNVEPNTNQNATEFWYQVFYKYLYEGEALIVMADEQLLLADSFVPKEYALYPNTYKNVTVKDFTFNTVFYEKDVFHFKLTDKNIKNVIDSLYNSYGKLLSGTMNSYKRKNNKRWFANADYIRGQDDETQKEIDDMLQAQLKDWFDPDKEAVVFQKQKGYEMEDASDTAKQGMKADSGDIRNMIDDIFNFVAMGFHVPRTLLKGDVAEIEENIDSLIMFALNPVAEVFNDELNRKLYKREGFIKRSYTQIDTSKIKLLDLSKLAVALDKLFAIGGATINEVMEELGKNPINEPWANERYITKNYQKASMPLEGGEK